MHVSKTVSLFMLIYFCFIRDILNECYFTFPFWLRVNQYEKHAFKKGLLIKARSSGNFTQRLLFERKFGTVKSNIDTWKNLILIFGMLFHVNEALFF